MKFIYKLLLFLFIATSFSLFSQTEANQTKRGSVALVLSGGGAKGFAQIPILEMIEEVGIPIDLIIGTSVGAIVGSLYGAGYSPQEIHEKTKDLEWGELFNDPPLSKTEQFLQKRTNNTLIQANFGEKIDLKLGNSLSQGQNVYNFLRSLLCKIPSNISFYDLPIPTIITGTNLFTGEQIFFSNGDLTDCIRASISIPGFFDFAQISDTVYIDGGTLNNLPVQYAKKLGFEFIIAINIGEQTTKDLEQFDSSPIVAVMQILRLGQSSNHQKELKIADLLITPDMKEYTFLSFNKGRAIYQAGQESAKQAKESLISLKKAIFRQRAPAEKVVYPSQSEKAYKNQKYFKNPQLFIKTPISQEEKSAIKKIFDTVFSSKKDFTLITEQNLPKFIQEVYKTGNYTQISTHLLPNNENTIIEVSLVPKKDRNIAVNLGLNYSGLYGAVNQSQFLASSELLLKNLTSKGSLLAAGISGINGFYAHAFYIQPCFKTSFFETSVNFKNYKKGIYPGLLQNQGTLLQQTTTSAYLGLHYNLSEQQQFSFGTRYNLLSNQDIFAKALDLSVFYTFTTFTKSIFRQKGITLFAKSYLAFPLTQTTSNFVQRNEIFCHTTVPLSRKVFFFLKSFWGCNTTNYLTRNSSLLGLYGFSLGDENFLLQIPADLQYVQQKLAFNTGIYYNPFNELTIFGGNVYGFLSASLCFTGNKLFNFEWKNPHWNSSLGLALEIKKKFAIISHLGVGSYEKKVYPFITLTIGSFYY